MLTRKTVILLELESTYGTDPVPVAADDGIYASDVEVEPMGEVLERDYYRDTLSKLAPVIGMKEAQLTFKTELKGSGAAGTAPKIGKLFQGCGMGETISAGVSVTYAPQSAEASVKSLTFYVYKDGNLHKITGARGTYVVNLEAGKYGTISWTFKGLYNDVSASAAPSITMSETTLPPIVYNASFTWGAYAAVASALSIDYGNALTRRESFNAASGVGSFRIGDRKPQGSFNPEAVVEATHPFWGDWKASTARALSIVVGATAGNICTINAPKCVSTGLKYSDDEGVALYDTQFILSERLVTLVENIMCGNAQPAINARKKKCVNGHLFTPNNIYPHKRGHRICKKCKIIKLREYYERNKHKHRHRYDQFDKRGDVNHIFGRHYCKCGKVKP